MTTVLVVEDSEPLGKLLATTLSRAGHAAEWVATGAAAIARVATAPEVVFVDLHLADMDGTELLGRLRESAPACRVIGLSGAEPAADVVRQFDAFLLKPVALDSLLAAVTSE